ncbi:MAG TPA: transcription termination/antitermination NusG family protein [Candidatus Dormibacteraeota bacterium]|jgi:transcriptional antiterminator RfaH|nr:transcription termination/antitermination NusG family protein [Candidatus Dormibacteraeota bacterium]
MNSLDSASWYAIHTKPRQEERAFANLTARGIEVLAPRLPIKNQDSSWKPFFPGYIFAKFSVECMLQKISFTRGVTGVVSFGGVPAMIDDEVIASIKQRTDARGVLVPVSEFKRGDRLLIQAGPLRNFIGVFEEELPASMRIRILLTTVAFSAHVEVSRFDVNRVSAQA